MAGAVEDEEMPEKAPGALSPHLTSKDLRFLPSVKATHYSGKEHPGVTEVDRDGPNPGVVPLYSL